jgi:hypothetical protein
LRLTIFTQSTRRPVRFGQRRRFGTAQIAHKGVGTRRLDAKGVERNQLDAFETHFCCVEQRVSFEQKEELSIFFLFIYFFFQQNKIVNFSFGTPSASDGDSSERHVNSPATNATDHNTTIIVVVNNNSSIVVVIVNGNNVVDAVGQRDGRVVHVGQAEGAR